MRLSAVMLMLGAVLAGCDEAVTTPLPVGGDTGVHNVLLIAADDLGLQLGSYGETQIQTPQLDALAARGTQFDIAYVTQASCSPSRASLMTGLYNHATGHFGLTNAGFALHDHLLGQTLPNLLKDAGYRTGLVGKLHVNPEASFRFDYRPRHVDAQRVTEVARAADEFLQREKHRPFFLMLSFADPHALFDREAERWYFARQVDGLPANPLSPDEVHVFEQQQTDSPGQRERTAGYLNAVRRLDAGVGMVMEALRRHGLEDNTLVIFIGDHGPPFDRGKTTTYEFGLRVPFIVHWPGLPAPARSQAMVSTVDILPTILDALSLPAPQGVHGQSLRGLLQDPEAGHREYLMAEYHFHGATTYFPRRAIRDQRFKLIHNLIAGSDEHRPFRGIDGDQAHRVAREARFDDTPVRQAFETFMAPPEYELYDLVDDPVEFFNLAGQAEFQDVEARLKQALLDWRQQTDDPFLDPAYVERYANYTAPARKTDHAH